MAGKTTRDQLDKVGPRKVKQRRRKRRGGSKRGKRKLGGGNAAKRHESVGESVGPRGSRAVLPNLMPGLLL